jgi:integrase
MGKFNEVKGKGWYFDTRISLGDGVYQRITGQWYATKAEAKAAFLDKQAKIIEGLNYSSGNMLFDDFIEEFREYRSHKIAASTVVMSDDPVIACYFKRFYGRSIADVFSLKTVQPWYHDLCSITKITNKRKNKVLGLFKEMLKFAYQNMYIDPKTYQLADVKCYAFKADPPSKERVAWTKEEGERFLKAIPDGSIDRLMFSLFLATAPRIGEFLALMPKCFDFKNNSLSIFQQVDYEGTGNYTLTDRLKTRSSYRTIYLPSFLMDTIKRYIDDFAIGNEDYLFSAKQDHREPLSRNAIRVKFAKYIKIAGIRYCPLHGIRHYLSTYMSSQCETMADIEAVASMMGHSVSTDLKIYASHNKEDNAKRIVEKVSKA